MSSLKCRPVALSLLLVFLAGCTSWAPTTIAPGQVIDEEQPSQVRVTRADGTQLTVEQPVIRGDSIAGSEEICSGSFGCYEGVRGVVSLDDVASLEVRRVNAIATIVVLAVIPLVFVIGDELCFFDRDSDACN